MVKIGRNDSCPCGSGKKYKKCCGAPITQSSPELKLHLTECIEFLIKSCLFYDEEDKAEAKRIALEIRKLVHDTEMSKSILSSLRRKDMVFINTGLPYMKENLVSHMCLVATELGYKDNGRFDVEYVPLLNDATIKNKISFDKWWNYIVISDNNNVFTREDIILCLANQDGGAHVGQSIEKDYYNLTRNNTSGFMIHTQDGDRPVLNLHLATTRQIAHEIILTLLDELPELMSNKQVIKYIENINDKKL